MRLQEPKNTKGRIVAQNSQKIKTVSFWLITLLAFSILFLLVYRERAILGNLALRWDWKILGGSFLLFILGLLLAAFVWANLMQAFGSRLPFSSHVTFFIISNVAKRLPGTVWYIVGRGYLYKQQRESLRLVSIASTVELLLQTASGILVAIAFSGFSLPSTWALPWWYSLVVFLVGLGVLLLLPRLLTTLSLRLLRQEAQLPLAFSFSQIFRWTIFYSFIWMLGGGILFLVTLLYIPVSPTRLPFYISVWCTVGVLSLIVFFLPSNFGITEVGLSLFLSTVMPSSVAVLISLTARMITLGFELVLAIGILFFKPPHRLPFRRILHLE